MPSHIFNRTIEIVHNGVTIRIKMGCSTCAYGPLDDNLEPCSTCFRTSTEEFPYSLWLFDPNNDTDDGYTSSPSSGVLPRQQTIGHISVSETISTLKTYLQKDDLNFWYKLILQLITELQKLQKDKLIPAPSPNVTNIELNKWFKLLQQYIQEQTLERERQRENQKQNGFEKEDVVTVDSITAYPSQIARQYRDYAQEISKTDPVKARALRVISDEKLSKVSNAREITLPNPSVELVEIEAALKLRGIAGGRKR